MNKILFICHGNICRSVMAECITKKMLADMDRNRDFVVDSAATTTEEEGHLIYTPAKEELNKHGIYSTLHHARRVTESDMHFYDYVICMEKSNISELFLVVPRECQDKVKLLLDFTDTPGDIPDPYYTLDFAAAYDDIEKGCRALLDKIMQEGEK